MSNKKVLVTGGAGFIGSHTVELLLDHGFGVRVLDNLSTGHLDNLPIDHPNLEFVRGDIQCLKDVALAMQGVSYCIHLAAQVSVVKSIQDPVQSSRCNVQGFLHVLETARIQKIKKFIYASSAAVYGVPQRLPLDEESDACPISPYGLEKSINEYYSKLYTERYGLPTLGLRYFNVYGPRQDSTSPYSGVISIFMNNVKTKKPIRIYGDGKQTRDFVYVRDVALINTRALTEKIPFLVCNVATGASYSLLDLVELITAIGGTVPIEYHPHRAGDIPKSEAKVRPIVKNMLPDRRFTGLADGLKSLWAEY